MFILFMVKSYEIIRPENANLLLYCNKEINNYQLKLPFPLKAGQLQISFSTGTTCLSMASFLCGRRSAMIFSTSFSFAVATLKTEMHKTWS